MKDITVRMERIEKADKELQAWAKTLSDKEKKLILGKKRAT